MRIDRRLTTRLVMLIALMACLLTITTRQKADTGIYGGANVTLPFTDVMGNFFFCQIAEAYFSGLTNGTSATTFSPSANVTREQMAAFITRTQDAALRRGNKRAAMGQWWKTTPHYDLSLGTTSVDISPQGVVADGQDIWVAHGGDGIVMRIRASDGTLVQTWTGAGNAHAILSAMGLIFVTSSGDGTGGRLYLIDPTKPPGPVTLVTNSLSANASGITFDGNKLWVSCEGNGQQPSAVSIITPGASLPWSVTTLTTGFDSAYGVLFDGINIWVTTLNPSRLLKVDLGGNIVQTINMISNAVFPVFDGTNLWVPNAGDQVTVVRASDSNIIAVLTGNGLDSPVQAAFDGERIIVTNYEGNSVSLWRATDLTPLGSFSTGADSGPYGVCSDGLNFSITLLRSNKLARY